MIAFRYSILTPLYFSDIRTTDSSWMFICLELTVISICSTWWLPLPTFRILNFLWNWYGIVIAGVYKIAANCICRFWRRLLASAVLFCLAGSEGSCLLRQKQLHGKRSHRRWQLLEWSDEQRAKFRKSGFRYVKLAAKRVKFSLFINLLSLSCLWGAVVKLFFVWLLMYY